METEQRRFSLRIMRDYGMGKKSIESKIQDDLLEFLDKVQQCEGKAIQHTRIFSSHVVSTLVTVLMTDTWEKAQLVHLAYIVQEK